MMLGGKQAVHNAHNQWCYTAFAGKKSILIPIVTSFNPGGGKV